MEKRVFNNPNDYISIENVDIILEIIQKLQEDSPFEPVTTKKVFDRMEFCDPKDHFKKKVVYRRLITRAFKKLIESRKLIDPENNHRYWLPHYWENRPEKLKKLLDLKKDKMMFAKTFFHAMNFCKSDEDWELLYAFYRKMKDNEIAYEENYRRDHGFEDWEEEQKDRQKILRQAELEENAKKNH